MCDEHSVEEMKEAERRMGEINRRRFGALSLATGLALMLPPVVDAAEVAESELDIRTPDGMADAYFVHPATGRHPAVLMWTDIMGLRPAFKMMGKRLAQSGYSVLVPNPYYRVKKAPVVAPDASMTDASTMRDLRGLMGSLTADTNVTDAKAFVTFLDAQASVDKKKKMGSCGYCMGGPLTMRTAATLPDRVGAGATFHGAGLVTDQPDSPHLVVAKMKASFLIAIAESDDMRQPDAKIQLREAFAAAKLPAEIEVYTGTMHGWCPPDSAVYNEAQAEKAWGRMLALFSKALV